MWVLYQSKISVLKRSNYQHSSVETKIKGQFNYTSGNKKTLKGLEELITVIVQKFACYVPLPISILDKSMARYAQVLHCGMTFAITFWLFYMHISICLNYF